MEDVAGSRAGTITFPSDSITRSELRLYSYDEDQLSSVPSEFVEEDRTQPEADDSDYEADLDDSTPVEDNVSDNAPQSAGTLQFKSRFDRNMQYLTDDRNMNIEGPRARWVEQSLHPEVVKLVKPTASKFCHMHLHPALYSFLYPVGSLDNLADLLDVPDIWTEVSEFVKEERSTLLNRGRFLSLDHTANESEVETSFVTLVNSIFNAVVHGLDVIQQNTQRQDRLYANEFGYSRDTHIGVRGLLVDPKYVVRSRTDPYWYTISNGSRKNLFATELKTPSTFNPDISPWYRGSRGVQTFCASFGLTCPTLLLSQNRWKLVVYNRGDRRVVTLPFGHSGSQNRQFESLLVGSTDQEEFLDVLVVLACQCLSKQEPQPFKYIPYGAPSTQKLPFDVTKSAQKKRKHVQEVGYLGEDKSAKRSLRKSSHQPGFYTGEKDSAGKNIFRQIHVLSPAEMKQFEVEIQDHDTSERGKGIDQIK